MSFQNLFLTYVYSTIFYLGEAKTMNEKHEKRIPRKSPFYIIPLLIVLTIWSSQLRERNPQTLSNERPEMFLNGPNNNPNKNNPL